MFKMLLKILDLRSHYDDLGLYQPYLPLGGGSFEIKKNLIYHVDPNFPLGLLKKFGCVKSRISTLIPTHDFFF